MYNTIGQAPGTVHDPGVMKEPNMLLVYSPRIMETQVIRPLVMNFDRQSKHDLSNAIGAELSSQHAAYSVTEAMKSAILPDPIGFKLDSDAMGSKYTFVLIISEGNEVTPLGIRAASVKHVVSGYFTEQPFSDQYLQGFALNEQTAINPNAVMVFTDIAKRMSGSHYDAAGQHPIRSNVGTEGIYSDGLSQIYRRDDVCTLTPEDLAKTKLSKTSYGPEPTGNPFIPTIQTATENISVEIPINAYIKNMRDPVAIDNHIQCPVAQLNKIIDAVSETNMFENNNVAVNDIYLSHRPAYGRAVDTDKLQESLVADQLPGREQPPRSGIIRFDIPMYLQDLFTIVPMISTHYIKLDKRPQFDVVAQDTISLQTQLSSLATHLLSNICVDLGFASATIGYQSYSMQEGFISTTPMWFIDDVEVLDPRINDVVIDQMQKRLLFLLEEHLFKVIRHLSGDFEFLGVFMVGADALIQLKLMDVIDSINGGFTTTPLSWGAAVSNLVGTTKHAAHNATQLTDVICENTGTVPTF